MAPLLENREGVDIIVQSREHLPPHIHACYGDDEALVNIRTGEMFKGYLPPKKLKVVLEWLAEGENRKNTEINFYELNPRLNPDKEEKKSEEEKGEKKKSKKKKNKKKGGK
jgi:hypothetical protein